MRLNFRTIILSFALMLPAIANASGIPADLNELRAEQARIRTGVEAHNSGAYKELSANTRTELLQKLLQKQQAMLALIEGKAIATELTPEQQAEVSATLTWIEQKLQAANDERMVCERRVILGSNRKERVCMTAANMRAQREAAREEMDRRGICSDCKTD
jgi:hypothetical protein